MTGTVHQAEVEREAENGRQECQRCRNAECFPCGARMALQSPDHNGGGEREPGPRQDMQRIRHRLTLWAADQH